MQLLDLLYFRMTFLLMEWIENIASILYALTIYFT
jgi:hypothetical protein